jgi:hypothetical protein
MTSGVSTPNMSVRRVLNMLLLPYNMCDSDWLISAVRATAQPP